MLEIFQMRPVLAETFFGPLYAHSFFFAVGGLVGAVVLAWAGKRSGLRSSQLIEQALWIFLAGLVGARLGYVLAYPSLGLQGSSVWVIWDGGLISFTGIVTGSLMAWGLSRRLPWPQRGHWYDAVIIALLTAWTIGRWGNYYAAESVGVPSEVWTSFYYRVPIQLFESAACALLVVGLAVIGRSWPAGRVAVVGSAGYFIARAIIDTWRDETVLAGLRLSQWTAVAGLLAVVCLAWWASRNHRHE